MLNNTSLRILLALALGAIPGALSRYYLGSWFGQNLDLVFPLGTFFVNLSGCFLMGLVANLALERWNISPEVRLSLSTGFIGSYTTFSSYELDSLILLIKEHWIENAIYWIGSPVFGLVSFNTGAILAKKFEQKLSQREQK